MTKFKRTMNKIGRHAWDFFKASVPAGLIYMCAGSVLMMITMKEDQLQWDSAKLTWTIVCILAAAAYNAVVAYAQGGQAYEMLVSGNMKRVSAARLGDEYKISAHKEEKEFRYWKGFAIGGFTALVTLIFAIVFGVNQTTIDSQKTSQALGLVILIGFFIAGWALLPLYYLNISGVTVSYFFGCLIALVPVVVTGATYIWGAFGKRNKTLREQEIADRQAEREAQREKKINYGGLPGTKPKKRK
jgi:hypothetical protein